MKVHTHIRFALLSLIITTMLLLATAHAVEIYHSPNDDGIPATNFAITPNGAAIILHLYITGDNSSSVSSPFGTTCSGDQAATGTELCGWDIIIEALDGLQIVSFNPAAGVTHILTPPDILRANGGKPLNASPMPEKIGDITISANSFGSLQVTGRHYVTASMQLLEIIIPIQLALAAEDNDGDGIANDMDNCSELANPNQIDSNNDGFGNACDADLNNDGAVNFADLAIMRSVFFTPEADADLNGDGAVNFADLAILRSSFFSPPGPSGVNP